MKNVNDLSGLTKKGFESNIKQFDPAIFESCKVIDLICPVINKYFIKTKTICTASSSYGIKHMVQKYLGQYVSNGELIYAMNKEGYLIKRNDINCYFNIKETDLKCFTKSREILDKLSMTVENDIRWYVKNIKDYQKYKYNFRCIIDTYFSQSPLLKRYVVPVISKEIGEDVSTVKYWFDLRNNVNIEIPVDKFDHLKKIFGFSNNDFMINNEA